ncbi:MAG TPA: hypothetical protein DCW29_24790 [Janthinobacterium sp.]|nr:hypothetical protein [Janthinobacterium sp.]
MVFPGVGHFTLGRPGRACLFLLPAAVGAIYMTGQVMARVNLIVAQVESGALALDPQAISERLSAAAGAEGPWMSLAVAVCVLCWAGSVIDALLLGDGPGPDH